MGGDDATAPDDAIQPQDQNRALQVVDPAVSRTKFTQQLDEFRARSREHQRRGWWLLRADFPSILVAFTTAQLKPPAVVCGVLLDFTNYDAEPPSVRLVDPFTEKPYLAKELPTILQRRKITEVQLGPAGPTMQQAVVTPLMQSHDTEEVPFLCLPGVREYHEHPAHTGDSWFLHRGNGEGTLFSILNAVFQYGVQPINGYGIGLKVTGFNQAEPPE